MIKNWRNLKISYNLTIFDLQWVKLTLKQQNFYIFGISEQFAIRKSTILIYRATSILDLHIRNFNLQGLGAPDKPKKKKIKYAEIDFTSHHSFLRVIRDQFRQNCKKTHPIEQSYLGFDCVTDPPKWRQLSESSGFGAYRKSSTS
jgi:hypothetical protein